MDPMTAGNSSSNDCSHKAPYEQRSIQELVTNNDQDSLIQDVDIRGTKLKLTYNSAMHSGTKTFLTVTLTGSTVPSNLWRIHAILEVEGVQVKEVFEREDNIKWTVFWDGHDAYGQPVIGQSLAKVKAGYEFTVCNDIIWDTKTIKLEAQAPMDTDFYGWSLNIHHRLEPISGVLYHGSGAVVDLVKGFPQVEDIYEVTSEDEIPIALASNGQDVIFLGTNLAIYELNTAKVSVSLANIIFIDY